MFGKLFASFGPASDGFFKALASIDVLLQAGTLLMLNWAFGWRIMAIASVFWGSNAAANFYWTGGAFLRQDWIFLLVSSMCLARKRYFGLAGAALTWSALLRVFPMIAFGGWAIVMAIHLWKKRALHPDHKRVIAGCVVCVGLLIPASMVVSGPNSYKEFVSHIRSHNRTPLTNHMGLETMLVHNWDGRMRFTRDATLDDNFQLWKQGRNDRFDRLKPVFFAIALGVFAWMAWALRRSKALWIAGGLSVPLIVSLTNLTCYYFSYFLILIPICRVVPALAPALLVTAGASQVLLDAFYFIDDEYTALSYLFYAASLLGLVAYSRPFSMERLRAWLAGKAEPRSGGTPGARPAPPAPSPGDAEGPPAAASAT
jgi:hypothetical protein